MVWYSHFGFYLLFLGNSASVCIQNADVKFLVLLQALKNIIFIFHIPAFSCVKQKL